MKSRSPERLKRRDATKLIFGALANLVVGTDTVNVDASARANEPLFVYDLAPADHYDLLTESGRNNAWAEVHVVAALQGIVNRDRPRLYVTYVSDTHVPGGTDKFWLEQMRAPDGWLADREAEALPRLEDIVARFRSVIAGVVLYDLSVPATSNVGSTIAGCDNLLPIPYDPMPGSVYDRLVQNGPKLPVVTRLIKNDGSPLFTGAESGSAKCDAYLWAKRNYLDSGKCDPAVMAYQLDAFWLKEPKKASPNCHGLSNHDYFVSRRAFFFDLSPWDDELPQDDTEQPLGTDCRTLEALLRSAYDRTHGDSMIHVGGFVPWAWKYTHTAGGKHGDVASEWRYAAILSCYNAYMDADALGFNAIANSSVFTHFPLKRRYPQPKPTLKDVTTGGYIDASGKLAAKTFVSFYVGDYDSASWLYRKLPTLWTDPARGTIPLGWAFNPNLADRFPVGMDWARRTATANDHFISGDSGAGYLNPGNLDGARPYSHLPSGLKTWEDHCKRFYRQWDITLTGFVIDGDAREMSSDALAAYARFSPDGIVAQKLPARSGVVSGTNVPYLVMGSDMPNPNQLDIAIERIKASMNATQTDAPKFRIFRTVLWSPSQHAALFERIRAIPDVVIVDPYTLMMLVRLATTQG